MFDSLHLLEDHSQANNRFAAALVASLAFVGLSTTAMLGAERMQISRVEAPSASAHLLFVPTLPLAPEAKRETPPDAPKAQASAAAATPDSQSSPRPDRDESEPSSDRPDPSSTLPPKPGTGSPGVPGLPPGFKPGGGATGIGTCTVNCGPGRGTQVGTPKPLAPRIVKREQLNCISCPDPSTQMLRRVARGNKRSGRNVTRFCVDERGRVGKVRTTKSIGDGQVDALIKQTVARWRFNPFRVDGKAHRACTTASFNIEFR